MVLKIKISVNANILNVIVFKTVNSKAVIGYTIETDDKIGKVLKVTVSTTDEFDLFN